MRELFTDFEVNREPRWELILWLLLGSVAAHFLLITATLYVPGLRDAFNIAALVADTSFVDKPYEKTEIADDVQVVDLSYNRFRYPDGYFAVASGMTLPPPAPVVPPPVFTTSGPARNPQPAPTPLALPSPSPSGTPSPGPATTASPAQTTAQVGSSPNPKPTEQKAGDQKMTPEQAQAELEKSAAKNNMDLPTEGEINKKPLKDFAAFANDLKQQGKLDLDKPFEIVVEAELDENGKLKDARFTKKEGDPNLVDLFSQMISALNDSGFLVYLKPLDKDNPGSKIVFTIKQGETDVLATVESETSSDEKARLLAKGFNALLAFGADSRAGKDEEVLMRNTTAEPVGKKLILNFTMPRQAVVDLIKKQLAS